MCLVDVNRAGQENGGCDEGGYINAFVSDVGCLHRL